MTEEINAGLGQEKPKGHIRGIWAITIIIVIAILVGGGVWYWYYKTTVQDQTTTNTIKISPSASPSASGSTSTLPSASGADETADWKTYTNSTYDFFFKYPSLWTTREKVSPDDDTLIYVYSNEKFGPAVEPIQYYIWVTTSSTKPTTKYSTTKVGGYTAYRTDEEPSQSGALAYYITRDDKTYIKIAITPYDTNNPWIERDKYISIFDKILSTFKFL